MRISLGIIGLVTALGTLGYPAGPRQAGSPTPAPAPTGAVVDGTSGCWLNFQAKNSSRENIFIDISKSRISTNALFWSKIINTPNQNIQAGETRKFTLWAKSGCMSDDTHFFKMYYKKGPQTHSHPTNFKKGTLHDLGDLERFF